MKTSTYTDSSFNTQGYTRDSTFTYLGGLVTPQEYAEYDRVVSQIYLGTIARGNFNFSESDSASLYNMATLCPALGGKAVYKARSIVYAYNPNAYFDNDSLCAIYGIQYRKADQSVSLIRNKAVLMVYPNPTNDIIRISLENKHSETKIKYLRVVNMMGQVILSKQITEQEINLSLQSLVTSSGILLIQVTDELNNHYQTRIVYEK